MDRGEQNGVHIFSVPGGLVHDDALTEGVGHPIRAGGKARRAVPLEAPRDGKGPPDVAKGAQPFPLFVVRKPAPVAVEQGEETCRALLLPDEGEALKGGEGIRHGSTNNIDGTLLRVYPFQEGNSFCFRCSGEGREQPADHRHVVLGVRRCAKKADNVLHLAPGEVPPAEVLDGGNALGRKSAFQQVVSPTASYQHGKIAIANGTQSLLFLVPNRPAPGHPGRDLATQLAGKQLPRLVQRTPLFHGQKDGEGRDGPLVAIFLCRGGGEGLKL